MTKTNTPETELYITCGWRLITKEKYSLWLPFFCIWNSSHYGSNTNTFLLYHGETAQRQSWPPFHAGLTAFSLFTNLDTSVFMYLPFWLFSLITNKTVSFHVIGVFYPKVNLCTFIHVLVSFPISGAKIPNIHNFKEWRFDLALIFWCLTPSIKRLQGRNGLAEGCGGRNLCNSRCPEGLGAPTHPCSSSALGLHHAETHQWVTYWWVQFPVIQSLFNPTLKHFGNHFRSNP